MGSNWVKRMASTVLLMSMWIWAVPAARADDTYYMVILAYQGRPNLSRSAHTFATFVKVPDGKDGKQDFKAMECHTISWLPRTLVVAPLRLRPEPGRNLGLDETLKLAVAQNSDISAWGPYQIRKELFGSAIAKIKRLNSGAIEFKSLDGRFRPGAATNCFHAVSDIMDGPLLDTGTAYGDAATVLVRDHLARNIIEPTRVHRDLVGPLGLDRYPITFQK